MDFQRKVFPPVVVDGPPRLAVGVDPAASTGLGAGGGESDAFFLRISFQNQTAPFSSSSGVMLAGLKTA